MGVAPKQALDAVTAHAISEYLRLERDPEWKVNDRASYENIDTKRSVTSFNNQLDGKKTYIVIDHQGKAEWVTHNFGAALRETCKCGNAERQPFVIKVYDTWAAVTHTGSIRHGKFHKTLGEAKLSWKKALPLAPRLNEDEIAENSREWLKRRIAFGEQVIEEGKKKVREEERRKAREEKRVEEMIGEGFGAW